jgi:hypothetical protein
VLGHVEEPERGGRAVVVAEPRHAGDDVHVQVEVQRVLGEEHDVRLVAPDDVSQRRARRTQDRSERSGLTLGQIVEGLRRACGAGATTSQPGSELHPCATRQASFT